jgi:cathepsin A (carboxypeptidase C)
MANITGYLNQKWVKKALEKPSTYEFSNINKDIWTAFSNSGAFLGPTTKELTDVLDAYTNRDKVADVRVLVINGNLDYIANTPGNMWQYDRLEWSGQAEYSIKEWRPLPDGLAATGFWKATSNGRLALVAVDEAGHFLPGDVREGSYRIVQEWLRGGWRT